MANYEKELNDAKNGIGSKHPPNKHKSPEKFNPTDLASFRASNSKRETEHGVDRFKENALSLVDVKSVAPPWQEEESTIVSATDGMTKGELFAEHVEQMVMIVPSMKAVYNKVSKFQRRFFQFENIVDNLDNVMWNDENNHELGLDDWGVGCFIDFVGFLDRPAGNYTGEADWKPLSDLKEWYKGARGTKDTFDEDNDANNYILVDKQWNELSDLTPEESEEQANDAPDFAPACEYLEAAKLRNNMLLKDRFIQDTIDTFTYDRVREVYEEFMGEGAPLPGYDANVMTDYITDDYPQNDGDVIPDTSDYRVAGPNSCHAVIEQVKKSADQFAETLSELENKLIEFAPMWDEIKVRSAHSIRLTVEWFLEDAPEGSCSPDWGGKCDHRQNYIEKVKEIVHLFRNEEGEDSLVQMCNTAIEELVSVMRPGFVDPVTSFLANMEQLAWEGAFQISSCLHFLYLFVCLFFSLPFAYVSSFCLRFLILF
jgi:hypothetical protein